MAQSNDPTAEQRYVRWKENGKPSVVCPWFAFCIVPDYCTTPCEDCQYEGNLARADRSKQWPVEGVS